MLSAHPFSLKLSASAFILAILAAPGLHLRAQDSNDTPKAAYVDDWSHHHMIFSSPGTQEDAAKSGKLEKWQKITNDSRYKMQQTKRGMGPRTVVVDSRHDDGRDHSRDGHGDNHDGWDNSHDGDKDHRGGSGGGKTDTAGIEKDWNTPLGTGEASTTITVAAPVNGTNISGTSTLHVIDAGNVTFTASAPVAASKAGTFTAAPGNAGTTTITFGGNAMKLTAGNTFTTGSITALSTTVTGDKIVVGDVTYTLVAGTATNPDDVSQATSGGTAGHDQIAENLAAAINADSSLCGTTVPCFGAGTVANPKATASVAGAVTTITNTFNANIALTATGTGDWTLSPLTGGINASATQNTCSLSTTGTFITGSSAVNAAANLAAAINACYASFPAVGVTATSASGVVTVSAVTPGTGGNSVALADGLTNFGWAGGATSLSGGSDGTSDTTHFIYWSVNAPVSQATLATNIAAVINANTTVNPTILATANSGTTNNLIFTAKAGGTGGNAYTIAPANFTAVSPTGTSTLSGGTTAAVQPNAFPAKYGASLTTYSCANDFVAYPTGQAGSPVQATIIAYNELYGVTGSTGCGATATVPSAYWAYNTATSGDSVATSPIISPYGDQLAYIQSNGTYASLVVLKWAANSADSMTTPETLTTQSSGANYRNCTAPCMITFELSPVGTRDDTFSSPYYDWNSDTVYVGDDSGNLHQFTGVFFGSPSETVAGNWPKQVSAGVQLSSPVFDDTSAKVFVGNMGGSFYSLTGAGVIAGTYTGGADAIADAPIVDGTQGTVYAVANKGGALDDPNINILLQFTTGFTTAPSGFVALYSSGAANGLTGHYLYDGAFDNLYYQTPFTGGNYYVVGNTAGTITAQLFKVPITSGNAMGTVSAAVTNLTVAVAGVFPYPWASPVTEFCNGACTVSGGVTNSGTDYIFFSMNRANVGGCASGAGNGCVLSYNVSNPAAVTIATATNDGLHQTTPGTNGCWATGGIVLDNDAALATGGSQIYFVSLVGNTAGAANTNGATSTACTTGTSTTINAVQAQQAAP